MWPPANCNVGHGSVCRYWEPQAVYCVLRTVCRYPSSISRREFAEYLWINTVPPMSGEGNWVVLPSIRSRGWSACCCKYLGFLIIANCRHALSWPLCELCGQDGISTCVWWAAILMIIERFPVSAFSSIEGEYLLWPLAEPRCFEITASCNSCRNLAYLPLNNLQVLNDTLVLCSGFRIFFELVFKRTTNVAFRSAL